MSLLQESVQQYLDALMLNRYGEALLSVIYGNADPKQAVETAEADRD